MNTITARRIAANPADHPPRLRAYAWFALKSAQGCPVRQSALKPRLTAANQRGDAA